MKILVYLRRGQNDFYIRLAKETFPNADIISVSDFKNTADLWFGNYIYRKMNAEPYFYDEELEDIRLRCRFLRTLEKEVAYTLINNLAHGLHEVFVINKIDLVIGNLIDCYTLDVLERITKEFNILYISFVGHFFNGYCRISARGELRQLPRKVSQEEVETVLSQVLNDNYKPDFKLNRPKRIEQMLFFYSCELFKKNLFFPLKKLIEHDPLNYHYNTTLRKGWTLNSVIRTDLDKYFIRLNDIPEVLDNNYIYLPLHFTPEATVDYWADNPMFALQEETILKLVKDSPAHIKLVIKEHPAMYMRREILFYEKLCSFSNVELIHPYESSNDILNRVENVIVFTGSVGVEALLRNKRVLTLTKNYYSDLHPNIYKIVKVTDEILSKKVQRYPRKQFVHDLLQGLFRARFHNDKTIGKSDIEGIATNLRNYYQYIREQKIE